MSKTQFLNRLFDAHAKDLQEFYAEEEDIFICPICMTGFSRDAIKEKNVTDGHVWPKSIRMVSKKARNMHVLLCADCNHVAGERGDAQMQLHEEIRKGEETGKPHRSRIVHLRRKQDDIPISLNAVVSYNLEDKSITVSGRLDRDAKWRDSRPEDQARFMELFQKQEPVDILIHPPRDYKPELAEAGWITSAYLMGFYSLGYRFIFHPSLDPVREYILNSFDKTIKENPVKLNPDDFGIWEQKSGHSADPELLFMVPFELGKRVYLQANCLKYEIRLPFRYRYPVLMPILHRIIPGFAIKLPSLREAKETVFFSIPHNKISGHRSWYDDLLGTPHIKREPFPQDASSEESIVRQ